MVTLLISLPCRTLARAGFHHYDLGNLVNKWNREGRVLKTAFGRQKKRTWHLIFHHKCLHFEIIVGWL